LQLLSEFATMLFFLFTAGLVMVLSSNAEERWSE
jgi:hypothetical protein